MTEEFGVNENITYFILFRMGFLLERRRN